VIYLKFIDVNKYDFYFLFSADAKIMSFFFGLSE